MGKKLKKICVLTSGGDAPGMNAAIRSVARTCAYYRTECVGAYRGYQGIIENDFIPLTARSVNNIIHKGGTMLKSARSKDFRTKKGREKAFSNIVKNNIDGLVVIGGDGSFTGGVVFSNEYNLPIVGIPGTIDNDIYGTTHTLGYDTALNTAIEAIDKIRDTASSHSRLFFVEVMGRDAGFIALNTGVGAGAEEILIPEENLGLERMLESLKKSRRSGKSSSIVVVSESKKSGKSVYELAKYVEENMPDYSARVTILGHIQRGGSPTCFDRVLASRMGVKAVEVLLDGQKNVMVGLQNNQIITVDLEKAVKGKCKIDMELLRVSDIMTT